MRFDFKQPLVLHFFWHPDDVSKVARFVQSAKRMLSKDKTLPFSRSLDIPVFFWNRVNKGILDLKSPYAAVKTVLFLFVSSNTKSDEEWKTFYEKLPRRDDVFVVPIAVEQGTFHVEGRMRNGNAIRAFEWKGKKSVQKDRLFDINVAHSIYSFAFAKNRAPRKAAPLTLFLSHCKKDKLGEIYAKKIKAYVETETAIKAFFDKTEILAGEEFSSRLSEAISEATIILIETDSYSSSHWCQKEVIEAKNKRRPMISVDLRTRFEDRVFPGCSNIPRIHIEHIEKNVRHRIDFLHILDLALVETVRCYYSIARLSEMQRLKFIPCTALLLPRPPEISDCRQQRKNLVYYPEPLVFREESDWYAKAGIDARTILWQNRNSNEFVGGRCGISVSETGQGESEALMQVGLEPDSLQSLIQDISRHLLYRGTTLIYGGDLRENDKSGFTRFILDEAKVSRERDPKHFHKIENYLAYPLTLNRQQVCQFKSENALVLKMKECALPQSLTKAQKAGENAKSNAQTTNQVWSMALSLMRKKLVDAADIRICAGGRKVGYKGAMPGVLEETVLTLKKSKALYLLGGFGGATQAIALTILQNEAPNAVPKEWRCTDIRLWGAKNIDETDYLKIMELLKSASLKDLSNRAGLLTTEYLRLMCSPFVDECLFLLLKGIGRVFGARKGKPQ